VVSRRERRKAATREALIDAAARLFAERGVEGTTMDDIARAAGTSRTSVFNYFGYKEMLLCEIGARHVEEVRARANGTRSRRSPRNNLYALTDALADLALREPELVTAVAREMTHPRPERRRAAAERMRYGELVDEALDMLSEGGRLREPRRRDAYARAVVDLMAGALVRAGGDFPRERLRGELRAKVDLFLDGALAPGAAPD
jgi:AcrR family transcriptional regulator